MGINLDINQQGILPIPGMIDAQTMRNGYFTAIVDVSQATALKAGQRVKLLSTNTGPMPKVVAANQGDVAHGIIAYIAKDATFNAGDRVEVVYFGGNVIWLQATAVAITPGQQLEADSTLLLVQANTSNPVLGYALDYFAASGIGRVIQLGVLNAH
jgi:hypothetical protein